MISSIKYLLLFFLLSFSFVVKGQFYFLENTEEQIEVTFLREKIEAKVDQSFFNAIQIKNPTDKEVTFITNISYPASWSFIGEKNQRITLGPNDSMLIPYRAAPSLEAKGEIGYAIVASLTNLSGQTFKNEYSFVNIPKIKSILFSPINRVEYVSQSKKQTDIRLHIANNGNTDETFFLNYDFDLTIETPGIQEGVFTDEVFLQPFKDTIISLPINLIPKANYYNKKFHRVGIKMSTIDTTINTSIWLKELEKDFINTIPSNYTMLSAEIVAQNLFNQSSPIYAANINGNILLKKGGEFSYSAQAFNLNETEKLWTYGRYVGRYLYKGFFFEIGDVSSSMEQSMYGRGANLKLTTGKIEINSIYTKSTFADRTNFGLSWKHLIGNLTYEIGGSGVIDKNRKVDSKIAFIRLNPRIGKIGAINLSFAASLADWYVNEKKQQIGYSGSFGYYKNLKNTSINVRANYGERKYFGNYNGRLEINSNISHTFNPTTNISLNYYLFNYAPPAFKGDLLLSEEYNNFEEIKLGINKIINTKTTLNYGIISEKKESNRFYSYPSAIDYQTRSPFLFGNLRYRIDYYNSIGFSLKGGANFTTKYPNEEFIDIPLNKIWPSFILTGDYRSRNWGIYMSYYHGPYTIGEQFNYFYTGFNSRTIRVLPYFEFYLIQKYLKFVNRSNYSYDISSEINRLNFSNDLVAYLPYNFEVTFSGTIGYQSNIDKVTEEKYKYTSAYFEFKVRKDLNANQPRYQYHDLDVYFFKDLNGNGVKDIDEPGIKNILFSIQSDEKEIDNESFNTSGYFMPIDLLSDNGGHIEYKNIPNGFYMIEYMPIDELKGAYTSETNTQNIYIDRSKVIYVPFQENNKIFGKVILNRSKLSNLGNLDPANIKITAEDSHGKKYSTLTDINGSYNIYVPNVDRYSVKINNIFYENFELEQNDYEVQLNGYRQFEVNFIFNEKKRKINFTASYDYGSRLDGPGVEIVRRTNLAGTIKDATTLLPIVAKIRVIDAEGNEITSSNSSSKTGVFTASFVAGDDYTVEVTADDYWFYAEKLYSQQIVTFANLKKEILLKAITVGALIPMNTLNFESGKTEIPATSFPELERLLKVLKKNPTVKIAVHGHTDDLEIVGSQEDLAMERAKLVAKYLIANGYNRVTYLGHANTKPIAENDTEDGRRMNRRVEIVVTGK